MARGNHSSLCNVISCTGKRSRKGDQKLYSSNIDQKVCLDAMETACVYVFSVQNKSPCACVFLLVNHQEHAAPLSIKLVQTCLGCPIQAIHIAKSVHLVCITSRLKISLKPTVSIFSTLILILEVPQTKFTLMPQILY